MQGHPDHGAYSAAQPFVQHLPSLTISLPGQQRTMSLQEASQLSLQQFSSLYTVCQDIPLCSADSTAAVIPNVVMLGVVCHYVVSTLLYVLHLSVQDSCIAATSLLHAECCTSGVEPTCQLDTSSVISFEQESSRRGSVTCQNRPAWFPV